MARGHNEPESSTGYSVVPFLDWCQKYRAPRTYDWYGDYLPSFARSIPRDLMVDRLRPIHVQQWVDAQPGWGSPCLG